MHRSLVIPLLGGLLGLAVNTSALASPDPALAEMRQLLGQNRVGDAVGVGERASKAYPDDARVWMWLGRAYGRKAIEANLLARASWAGKTREAWEKAVALDPNNLEARFDLMQYYLQAPAMLGGGLDKAKAQADAIATIRPAYGQLAQGTIAMTQKDPAGAEAAWREAVRLEPTDHRVRITWSALLTREERHDELIAFWNEQAANSPDDAMVQFQLGRVAAITGRNLDAGLAALDRYALMPTKPTEEQLSAGAPEWRRGQILEKLGRTDEALAAYAAAVAANPNLAEAKKDLERLEAGRQGASE
jgi:tetratricopeptide (TPR) repeat protein